MSGAPFVYAAWVQGPGSLHSRGELAALLRAAREASGREAEGAAVDGARALGIQESVMRRYYAEQIRYAFDAGERDGLALFGSMLPDFGGTAPRSPFQEIRQLAGGPA